MQENKIDLKQLSEKQKEELLQELILELALEEWRTDCEGYPAIKGLAELYGIKQAVNMLEAYKKQYSKSGKCDNKRGVQLLSKHEKAWTILDILSEKAFKEWLADDKERKARKTSNVMFGIETTSRFLKPYIQGYTQSLIKFGVSRLCAYIDKAKKQGLPVEETMEKARMDVWFTGYRQEHVEKLYNGQITEDELTEELIDYYEENEFDYKMVERR